VFFSQKRVIRKSLQISEYRCSAARREADALARASHADLSHRAGRGAESGALWRMSLCSAAQPENPLAAARKFLPTIIKPCRSPDPTFNNDTALW
jgi:hypothetical protein